MPLETATTSTLISADNWRNLDRTTLVRLAPHQAALDVALQHPLNVATLKRYLREAQADGFDPKVLFEQALRVNQDSKYPPPTWDQVAP